MRLQLREELGEEVAIAERDYQRIQEAAARDAAPEDAALSGASTVADVVGFVTRQVRAAIAAAPGFGAGGGPLGHQAVTRPDHC